MFAGFHWRPDDERTHDGRDRPDRVQTDCSSRFATTTLLSRPDGVGVAGTERGTFPQAARQNIRARFHLRAHSHDYDDAIPLVSAKGPALL